MTHISRKKLDNKTEQLFQKLLISTLSGLKADDLEKFLSILLTNTEKVMLYKRLIIIYLLSQEYTPSQIKEITKTTIQTIERISLQAKTYNQASLNLLITKLDAQFKKMKLIDIVKESINSIPSRSEFKKKISPF